MTGEVSWVKPSGEDSNGEVWGVHAHVARALRCRLRPFDKYQGPYIAHKLGRLWIGGDEGSGGGGSVMLESGAGFIVQYYYPGHDAVEALAAARDVLKRARAQRKARGAL